MKDVLYRRPWQSIDRTPELNRKMKIIWPSKLSEKFDWLNFFLDMDKIHYD